MWFRNLHIYRLTVPFSLSPEQLAEEIQEQAFRPCGSLENSSYGWVSPLGRNSEALTHAANGRILLCARREEKVLPASVVRERVGEKAAQIEAEQQRPVGRKKRLELRDEITLELLPRAFTRSSLTYAYIDPQAGYIVVDAASLKKAEELMSLLRKGLGRLSAFPIATQQQPALVMSRWISGEVDSTPFLAQDECELREPGEEGAIVRCRRIALDSEEVQNHLEAGMQVTRLAVSWDERLRCVIDNTLAIKRLRFEDVVAEELAYLDDADEAAVFDAQFALMTLELARFIPALVNAFGGENEEGYGK